MDNRRFEERRAHPRLAVHVPVLARHGDREQLVHTEDLSEGGAKLRFFGDCELRVGDRIELRVRVPGLRDAVHTDAQVRWIDGGTRCGVAFGARGRAVLAAFFASACALSGMPAFGQGVAPTFDPDAPTVLDRDGSERPDELAVMAAFESRYPDFDACVDRVARGEERLPGTADMEVLLNPDGRRPLGINARLSSDAPKDVSLRECLRAATSKAPFPAYDGPPVIVEFTFELDPGTMLEDG